MNRRDILKLIPGFFGAMVTVPFKAFTGSFANEAVATNVLTPEPIQWPDLLGQVVKMRVGEANPDDFWDMCVDFWHRAEAEEIRILGQFPPYRLPDGTFPGFKDAIPAWAHEQVRANVLAPLGYLYRCLALGCQELRRTSFFDKALAEHVELHPGFLASMDDSVVPVLRLVDDDTSALNFEEWKSRLKQEIEKWRKDPDYAPIRPVFDIRNFEKFRELAGWTVEKAGMMNLDGAVGYIKRSEQEYEVWLGMPEFGDNPYLEVKS